VAHVRAVRFGIHSNGRCGNDKSANKRKTITVKGPGIAEWRRHSSGDVVWFAWWRGNIDVKNPDEEVIAKMRSVAKALNARVQGDDGEGYEEEPSPPPESPRPSSVTNTPINEVVARLKPWWKFW